MKVKLLIVTSFALLLLSCQERIEKRFPNEYYCLFRSENIIIEGNQLTYEVCEKNSFQVINQIEFSINQIAEKQDTITYYLQSTKDSLWSLLRIVSVQPDIFLVHNSNVYLSKSELIEAIESRPNVNINTFDYSYFTNEKINRDVIDQYIIGNYTDLLGNKFQFTESNFKATLNRIDDLTGDEYIVNIEYEIIERNSFGHWFYYILKNDLEYELLLYRLKTSETALIHYEDFGYENFEEIKKYVQFWKEKEQVPGAFLITKD